MRWTRWTKLALYSCLLTLCLTTTSLPGRKGRSWLFDGRSFQGWEGDTSAAVLAEPPRLPAGRSPVTACLSRTESSRVWCPDAVPFPQRGHR